MLAERARDAITLDGFLDDARAFLQAQGLEGFVFQARDRMAFIVVADPAFEGGVAAAVMVEQFVAQGLAIDGLAGCLLYTSDAADE